MPAWKHGDAAACRLCSGYHVATTFTCGHSVKVKAEHANNDRPCPPCRRARWEQIEQELPQRRAAARESYAACKDEAKELLDHVRLPAGWPEPLVLEWHRCGLNIIQSAIVRERHFGQSGAIGTSLAHLHELATQIIPAQQELNAAITERTPVRVLDKAYWPAGWLHHLGLTLPGPSTDMATTNALAEALTATYWTHIHPYWQAGEYTAANVTSILTDVTARWTEQQETKWRDRRWRFYSELSLPLAPGKAVRFGRLDGVIMRPDLPDIALEIDATNKAASAEKLAFAYDAGAIAVWVRWRGGKLTAPRGVSVIDLR